MRKVLTVLAGATLIAGAFAGPLSPQANAAAEPKNLQLMSWNMCGSQRTTWGCGAYGTPQQKIDVVRYHVSTNFVQAVLLQEVCENDLDAVVSQLGDAWTASFAPYRYSTDGVLTTTTCGDAGGRTDRIGTAIVVRAGLSAPSTHRTTQPWTGLNRPFHCATATYWGLRLCNVHLTPVRGNPDHPDWEYADDQLREIKTVVDGYPDVAFGGDFNVTSPEYGHPAVNPRAWLWPDGLYGAAGLPGYTECDQDPSSPLRTGRATHAEWGKLDHVFSTETRRWCAVGRSAYSDHSVIIFSTAVS